MPYHGPFLILPALGTSRRQVLLTVGTPSITADAAILIPLLTGSLDGRGSAASHTGLWTATHLPCNVVGRRNSTAGAQDSQRGPMDGSCVRKLSWALGSEAWDATYPVSFIIW